MQIEPKTLKELIPDWVSPDTADILVSGLSQDSRNLQSGMLFIARSGLNYKGIDFVNAAAANGAVAIVLDKTEQQDCSELDIPVIAIPELNEKIGLIAAHFYDYPSRKLQMTGITGTNGKTSCSHFMVQALNRLGVKAAVIGTLGNGFPDRLSKATHTTPDAIELQAKLAQLVDAGADAVVMEVSSHALAQGRVVAVDFDTAIFTNLTRDHLDYHGSLDNYAEAKAKLFRCPSLKRALINIDDKWGQKLLSDELITCQKIMVGREQGKYKANDFSLGLQGIQAIFKSPKGPINISSPIIGDFNLDNILLVVAALMEQGFGIHEIERGIEKLSPVSGRMQTITALHQPLVIIDYAHTPDALEKALKTINQYKHGMIWCVFGCGGDRDQGKRALMGQVADSLADYLVLTDDNPRTEQSEQIIAMIAAGIEQHEAFIKPDRASAIEYAISEAQPEDIILIAGKGHEDYQEINNERMPFSDLDICKKILEVSL